MNKLLILPILCVIVLSACQQKVNKENFKKETTSRMTTEVLTKGITEKESTPIESVSKTILDTIIGSSTNGEPIKILIYKYLHPNENKYLRDFDVVNNKDSIIFSGMVEELYQEEQRSEEEFLTVHMIPFYLINNTNPLTMSLGLYIKDIRGGADYCISKVIEYNIISIYEPIDSLLQFMKISFNDKSINSIQSKITPIKSKISTDSLYALNAQSKTNNALWIKQELCTSTLNLFLNDSISLKEAINLHPNNLRVSTCESYVPQYFFKLVKQHYTYLEK